MSVGRLADTALDLGFVLLAKTMTCDISRETPGALDDEEEIRRLVQLSRADVC